MPTICRLLQLSPDEAANLAASPASLSHLASSARNHSDVYRYWHALEYLIAQHRPGSVAAQWLSLGRLVSAASGDVPGARILSEDQVQALGAELEGIQPEDLIPHYDASAFDAAQIYPISWQTWEESFDPLGQVLEHYSFLQQFTAQCAEARAALLLYFEALAEGSV